MCTRATGFLAARTRSQAHEVQYRSCPLSPARAPSSQNTGGAGRLLIQSSRDTQNRGRYYPRVLNALRFTRKRFRTTLSIGAAAAWRCDASRILDSKRMPGVPGALPRRRDHPLRSSTLRVHRPSFKKTFRVGKLGDAGFTWRDRMGFLVSPSYPTRCS